MVIAASLLVWAQSHSLYRGVSAHEVGPPVLFRRDMLVCVGLNRPPDFQMGIGWDTKLSIAFLDGSLPSDQRACFFAPWNGPAEGELIFPP
jgi:hypothetical protein